MTPLCGRALLAAEASQRDATDSDESNPKASARQYQKTGSVRIWNRKTNRSQRHDQEQQWQTKLEPPASFRLSMLAIGVLHLLFPGRLTGLHSGRRSSRHQGHPAYQ